MRNPFTAHPNDVGETYVQHAVRAARIGITMIGTGVACLIHAVVPSAFETTGSRVIHRLSDELSARGKHQPTPTLRD